MDDALSGVSGARDRDLLLIHYSLDIAPAARSHTLYGLSLGAWLSLREFLCTPEVQ